MENIVAEIAGHGQQKLQFFGKSKRVAVVVPDLPDIMAVSKKSDLPLAGLPRRDRG